MKNLIHTLNPHIKEALNNYVASEQFRALALEAFLSSSSLNRPVKRRKEMPSGWSKPNRGFYRNAKTLFEEEAKVRQSIPFAEFLKEMQFLYPNLSYRRCYIYVSDRRRLPSIEMDAKNKLIHLRSNA